jgi:hypothetical protein
MRSRLVFAVVSLFASLAAPAWAGTLQFYEDSLGAPGVTALFAPGRPTTAGSSSGGNQYDIVPGHSANSIVSFRIHSTDASTQMPPIARSVVASEAVGIIDDWIDTVVDEQYEGGPARASIRSARAPRAAGIPTVPI